MLNPEAERQTLSRLTRLAQRCAQADSWLDDALAGRLRSLAMVAIDVAIETGDPIGRILAEKVRTKATDELAERLLNRFDELEIEGSVPLREVIFEATRRCWLVQREVVRVDADDEQRAEFARLCCNLSIALVDLGRREEALEAARKAVTFYRDLEEKNTGDFLSDLAHSLNLLASCFDELGDAEEALGAIREAVAIHRHLVSKQLGEPLELAMSLNNLGGAFFALGRAEESLAAIREAIAIRRAWIKEHADRSFVDAAVLADNLDNLGTSLKSCERPAEARDATLEAISLYRQLITKRPDIFRVDLARSLWNLGCIMKALDQPTEAAKATQESSEIYRQLAIERPEVFADMLAETTDI